MSTPGPVLAVEPLLEEAASRSGLDDWGDLGFASTLGLLLESCRETAALNTVGETVLHKVVLRHLRNRLYLQAFLSAHPERRRAALPGPAPPVVVTGLPRTGTTLLHNLLALDPGHRVLRFWEALHPVPPDPARGTSEEGLVAAAEAWLERLYSLTPRFRAIHGATARGPEECDALLQNSFASQHFDDMFRAESYSAWLRTSALAEEYAYYGLQLAALTRPEETGRRWVLKSPGHLGYLDTLRAVLPGALVVHCHRDPCEAVASYASLVLAVREPNSDVVSPAEVGRHALARSGVAMDRALAARDAAGGEGFVDVAYADLVADPVATARRLYARIGATLDDPTADLMAAWVAENPRHRHGPHRYTLEQFGLTAADVLERLATYTERLPALL